LLFLQLCVLPFEPFVPLIGAMKLLEKRLHLLLIISGQIAYNLSQ
jgi:hypothetical protein